MRGKHLRKGRDFFDVKMKNPVCLEVEYQSGESVLSSGGKGTGVWQNERKKQEQAESSLGGYGRRITELSSLDGTKKSSDRIREGKGMTSKKG